MKLENCFSDFIYKELEKNYYYNVERVCRNMSGNNGYKWYYEIFISNFNELSEDGKQDLLLERFIEYLDKNDVEYDKEYFADVIDYLSDFVCVYDVSEYIDDIDEEWE